MKPMKCGLGILAVLSIAGGAVRAARGQDSFEASRGWMETARAQGILPLVSTDSPFIYALTRAGERRQSVVLTPGNVYETDAVNASGAGCVSLRAAMPFNLGDGAVLSISLIDGDEEFATLELGLDPAHVREHRRWTPLRLEVPAGMESFRLNAEVGAGSRQDSTADWIGLAAGPERGCVFAEP